MTPILAEFSVMSVVMSVGAILFVVFVFAIIYASRYKKTGPNEVLIISGRKRTITDPSGELREVGFRVVKGGGRFVWPVFEKVDILSLELLTIDGSGAERAARFPVRHPHPSSAAAPGYRVPSRARVRVRLQVRPAPDARAATAAWAVASAH